MSSPKPTDSVLNAAQRVLDEQHDDGDMATSAILIILGMSQDGTKWISHKRSGDMRTWEAKGMLTDMLDTLAAMEVARQFEDEDEDSE